MIHLSYLFLISFDQAIYVLVPFHKMPDSFILRDFHIIYKFKIKSLIIVRESKMFLCCIIVPIHLVHKFIDIIRHIFRRWNLYQIPIMKSILKISIIILRVIIKCRKRIEFIQVVVDRPVDGQVSKQAQIWIGIKMRRKILELVRLIIFSYFEWDYVGECMSID